MPEPEPSLFADFAAHPEEHFRLCFFGSILQLMEGVAAAAGSFECAVEKFPFLAGYNNQLAERLSGLSLGEAVERWCAELEFWERGVSVHLPLRVLSQAAGLSHRELLWMLTLGLIEEDGRFGLMFETLQGTAGQRRPTLGFMLQCLPPPSKEEHPAELVRRATRIGVLTVLNAEAPRPEWIYRFPNFAWDALRAGKCDVDPQRMRYRPPQDFVSLNELVLPCSIKAQAEALPSWLGEAGARTVVVRGPRHNGRRTLLGAVARALGRGVLEITQPEASQSSIWTEAGLLALLLDAMPVAELTAPPGQPVHIPDLQPASVCLGVAMRAEGGLAGARASDAVILDLALPGPPEREQLWQRDGQGSAGPHLRAIANGFRLASGNISRAARFARTKAGLAGGSGIELADVLEATHALDRQGLDLLAQRLPGSGDLSRLCAGARTLAELEHLIRRCRHREALPEALDGAPAGRPGCGVRALLTGPSGTGKTLAARLLAGTLQKDLYRLDLSSVVNKYIGETEKNLHRLFECAEELDVILLLDEGDALLTKRTDVNTANDRYANLETNFLLQRMESFQGILLITTNTRERIDTAFERRMDVVVEFGVPSAEERWELWRRHLPATAAVEDPRLAEVAAECELTGGQIHNAVVYATLLALDNGGVVTSEYVDAAVRREYRKRGGVCPLRS